MAKSIIIILIITAVGIGGIGAYFILLRANMNQKIEPSLSKEIINLSEPNIDSNVSVEQALSLRRSIRDYKREPLALAEVSQLVWAAQGITNPERGFRTAPSAGALYPLELYVVAGNVSNLVPGVYKYNPLEHRLERVAAGDKRNELCAAALSQSAVKEGAMAIVFSGVYERTTKKYGERGIRYVHMEAGHAAQNVYLQAVSLHLGTAVIGAFEDQKVKELLDMPDNEHPLYIMPIGKK